MMTAYGIQEAYRRFRGGLTVGPHSMTSASVKTRSLESTLHMGEENLHLLEGW